MKVVPISLSEAQSFLAGHERHYVTPANPICAIGISDGSELRGAVILGCRGNAEAELSHIYSDGTSLGYTILYGAAWRALKALGYEKSVL